MCCGPNVMHRPLGITVGLGKHKRRFHPVTVTSRGKWNG